MTSSVDTAELFLVAPAAVPRRFELRHARRQRQRYALLGVLLMAVSLVMTVVVLDVVR
jgi:hypothetical protein